MPWEPQQILGMTWESMDIPCRGFWGILWVAETRTVHTNLLAYQLNG